MGAFRLDSLLDYLTSGGLLFGLLWLGLAVLSVALLLLMRTRWGQSRPVGKCLALSLLAHLLLAGYATTIKIVASSATLAQEKFVNLTMDDATKDRPRPASDPAYQQKPWDKLVPDHMTAPELTDMARADTEEPLRPERQTPVAENAASDPALARLALAEAVQPVAAGLKDDAALRETPASTDAHAIDAPKAQRREGAQPLVPLQPEPQRNSASSDREVPLTRDRQAGEPAGLFQQPAPPPRMTDVATSAEPDRVPPGLNEPLTLPAQGKPAEEAAGLTPSGHKSANTSPRMAAPSPAPTVGKFDPDSGPTGLASGLASVVGPPRLPMRRTGQKPTEMPEIYRLRVAPDRAKLAQEHGATSETEKAVKASLKWLAANQEADGRWNARRNGAGRELLVAGRDRQSAGIKADTGVTGLALLAFQAAGNTHLEGEYQPNVRRGLEFLLRSQAADGNLGGDATTFAHMYCHAMATFAMSEAYAMTKDKRLRDPVRRAVAYTVASQQPVSGGWRYKPRDPGDTSQLGWQLMALKSAELGGIRIPQQTRRGIQRYLASVSSGQYGGIASYRPGESQSRPMTAEALVCRQFLGAPPSDPACREAGNFLLTELPGAGEPNLYYWYYATLAMYQLQGTYWQRWNEALQPVLLSRQLKIGPLAGSWNPDTRWAGYGGRVYSTALATLCLEVYYRYLPLFVEVSTASEPAR